MRNPQPRTKQPGPPADRGLLNASLLGGRVETQHPIMAAMASNSGSGAGAGSEADRIAELQESVKRIEVSLSR